MLAPNKGSHAKNVVGLPTGVWTYRFSAQPRPEGQGVGRGRKRVGVPEIARVVEGIADIVDGCCGADSRAESSGLLD